jgi:hypothetical protein
MFNNIFRDNRAGTYDFLAGSVTGIGMSGDSSPANHWDMGVADGSAGQVLHPHHTLLQVLTPDHSAGTGAANDGTNVIGVDPNVVHPYDTQIAPFAWRGDPHFVNAITIAQTVAELLAGNYHLNAGSPALNVAVNSQSGVSAPTFDIDNQSRPSSGKDLGADER